MIMQMSKMPKESVKLLLSVENELPEVLRLDFFWSTKDFIMGNARILCISNTKDSCISHYKILSAPEKSLTSKLPAARSPRSEGV